MYKDLNKIEQTRIQLQQDIAELSGRQITPTADKEKPKEGQSTSTIFGKTIPVKQAAHWLSSLVYVLHNIRL